MRTKTYFFIFAITLVMFFVLYAFLLNKTIMNVVVREKTEREIARLSSKIGELEFQNMTAKNQITLDLAHAKGFEDTLPTKFIARGRSQTLTYNYP